MPEQVYVKKTENKWMYAFIVAVILLILVTLAWLAKISPIFFFIALFFGVFVLLFYSLQKKKQGLRYYQICELIAEEAYADSRGRTILDPNNTSGSFIRETGEWVIMFLDSRLTFGYSPTEGLSSVRYYPIEDLLAKYESNELIGRLIAQNKIKKTVEGSLEKEGFEPGEESE